MTSTCVNQTSFDELTGGPLCSTAHSPVVPQAAYASSADCAVKNGDADSAVVTTTAASTQNDGQEQPRPATKSAMCRLNDLVRYNKVYHVYELVSSEGPAHAPRYTVRLRLGGTVSSAEDSADASAAGVSENFSACAGKIRTAQQLAAAAALQHTSLPHPPIPPHTPPSSPSRSNNRDSKVPPTVELNALAMKRCEPVCYVPISRSVRPPVRQPSPPLSRFPATPFTPQLCHHDNSRRAYEYHVQVSVGGGTFSGFGSSLQAAKHAAAAHALSQLSAPALASTVSADTSFHNCATDADASGDAGKSSVTRVHEVARRHCLPVEFQLTDVTGQPHLRQFSTCCRVGQLTSSASAANKKLSKRLAADQMLLQLHKLTPPQQQQTQQPDDQRIHAKRCVKNTKHKPATVVKLPVLNQCVPPEQHCATLNAVSRVTQRQQRLHLPPPQFTLLDEREDGRRRQFVFSLSLQLTAEDSGETASCEGVGPTKRLAKRAAAEALLVQMGETDVISQPAPKSSLRRVSCDEQASERHVKFQLDSGRDAVSVQHEESEAAVPAGRQLVPGVILLPVTSTTPQPTVSNSCDIKEESGQSSGSCGGGSVDAVVGVSAQDQLLYLASVMKFHVQFADIPPRGSKKVYLSLVSLNTVPAHISHGEGATSEEARDRACLAALAGVSRTGHDDGGVV